MSEKPVSQCPSKPQQCTEEIPGPYTVFVLDKHANVIFRGQSMEYSLSQTRDVEVTRLCGTEIIASLEPVIGSERTVITLGSKVARL